MKKLLANCGSYLSGIQQRAEEASRLSVAAQGYAIQVPYRAWGCLTIEAISLSGIHTPLMRVCSMYRAQRKDILTLEFHS